MRIAPPSLAQLLLGIVFLTTASIVWSQPFSTLEERMSAAQFKAAGLEKLSPEELASLNTWLQEHTSAGAGSVAVPVMTHRREGLFGGDSIETDSNGVASRITGEFRGWSGKTTFHLDNGQIWQQVGNDKWAGVKLTNPEIRIEPAFMGSWRLKVEGYNTTTKVKRLR